MVVVHHGVVDNCGVVIDFNFGFVRSVISIGIVMMDSVIWDKHPVKAWDIHHHIDLNTWTKGSPSVVSAAGSPVDPSRSPIVARNPSPALEVIIEIPTSIMERGPAPVVIGNPSIAIFGHDPMALGAVRVKISPDRR